MMLVQVQNIAIKNGVISSILKIIEDRKIIQVPIEVAFIRSIISDLNVDKRFDWYNPEAEKMMIYTTVDGNLITVYSLLPQGLIQEKVQAYLKRRKIRDLYDIFFLLRYIKTEEVKKELKQLIDNYKDPIDEKELKVKIITGISPTSKDMLEYIRREGKV